jgi:hypothetical protein
MDVSSGFTVLAFRLHITVFYLDDCYSDVILLVNRYNNGSLSIQIKLMNVMFHVLLE